MSACARATHWQEALTTRYADTPTTDTSTLSPRVAHGSSGLGVAHKSGEERAAAGNKGHKMLFLSDSFTKHNARDVSTFAL